MIEPDSRSLHQLYDTELQPVLAELERQRIRVWCWLLACGVGVLGVAAIANILFGQLGLAIGGITSGIAASIAIGLLWQQYRLRFKQDLIGRLVAYYDPEIVYLPKRGIEKQEFRHSQLYRHRIDRYRREDLVKGKIGATAFRFSEVHAQYKTTSRSGGKTRTRWHTLFRGIFFVADFNKQFSGTTLVIPDQMERQWGKFGQQLQEWSAKLGIQPGQLVKLEDPEFERIFAVYASDQIEARYLLSTSLMQRLVRFRHRFNQPISLSFVSSNLYLAIPTRKNHFEPPPLWVGVGAIAIADLQAYLDDLNLAQEIIDDLNLNLRIWNKQ